MDNRYKIPLIYQEMNKRGYIDYSQESYVWLYEMEWMSLNEITHYEYDKGESRKIIPFAFTGGGDKWVWVVDEPDAEYCVGFCPHDDYNGSYYAPNTELGIFRHILEYVSDCNFYVNKSHAESYQVSEEELKNQLSEWKHKFQGLLDRKYLDVIDMLSKLPLKKVKSKYGEWYALLSLDECNELLNKYMEFELLDEEFEWCSE